MSEEKPQPEGQHWTLPAYVAPEIGDEPPVGAWIDKEAVCRNCMTAAEEIAMRRGFIDPIPATEAKEKAHLCTRCGKKIAAGS